MVLKSIKFRFWVLLLKWNPPSTMIDLWWWRLLFGREKKDGRFHFWRITTLCEYTKYWFTHQILYGFWFFILKISYQHRSKFDIFIDEYSTVSAVCVLYVYTYKHNYIDDSISSIDIQWMKWMAKLEEGAEEEELSAETKLLCPRNIGFKQIKEVGPFVDIGCLWWWRCCCCCRCYLLLQQYTHNNSKRSHSKTLNRKRIAKQVYGFDNGKERRAHT